VEANGEERDLFMGTAAKPPNALDGAAAAGTNIEAVWTIQGYDGINSDTTCCYLSC
jgi:hypothetical protein